jgi:hypothetical protein
MTLDVEAVHERTGRTGFERWLAIVVGVAAVVAATLAVLQVDTAKQEERALLLSSRLAVRAFEGTAGTLPRSSFQIGSLQAALKLGLEATARQLAAFDQPAAAEVETAIGQADSAASMELASIAEKMGAVPTADSGLDPATLRLLSLTDSDLRRLVAEQNRQVDLAEAAGQRGSRTVFAISLLALGAILAGLAGVIGRSTPGRIVLLAATVAILASMGWGVWSVVG